MMAAARDGGGGGGEPAVASDEAEVPTRRKGSRARKRG
jgi:hypothetical protein